jgi:DNA-binding MarR family transcriptional regulator
MSLSELLATVCRLTAMRLRVCVERIGIHPAQGRILMNLHGLENIPQQKIVRKINASPAAVTSVLQRMERDGWITRTRDPNDQRTVLISPSEKARALEEKAKGAFRLIDKKISSLYSKEERDLLRDLLLKLHNNIEKISLDCSDAQDSTTNNKGGKNEKSY